MKKLFRRSPALLGFLAAAVIGFLAPGSVNALPSRSSCFLGYVNCLDTAANQPDVWRRSAAGADCYVDLCRCVRDALFG